uniref:Uncharacterized protein n=1 Tax=Anguilla anguilla TaxID=7936 RepID=A0A0E9QD39_ANGAN
MPYWSCNPSFRKTSDMLQTKWLQRGHSHIFSCIFTCPRSKYDFQISLCILS